MDKEIIKKVKECRSLQGRTIADVVRSQEFKDNVAKYIAVQREDRRAILAYAEGVRRKGIPMKAPSHIIDEFIAKGYDKPEAFSEIFLKVIAHESGESARMRKYIEQLGMQAYSVTIVNAVSAEFPELKDELLNNKNDEN